MATRQFSVAYVRDVTARFSFLARDSLRQKQFFSNRLLNDLTHTAVTLFTDCRSRTMVNKCQFGRLVQRPDTCSDPLSCVVRQTGFFQSAYKI